MHLSVPGSPTDLTAHVTSTTSVTLRWSAPNQSAARGQRTRPIDAYELYIDDVESGRVNHHMVAPPRPQGSGSNSWYTVVDLQPFAVYRAYVSARNVAGEGPGSETVLFRMKETGKGRRQTKHCKRFTGVSGNVVLRVRAAGTLQWVNSNN